MEEVKRFRRFAESGGEGCASCACVSGTVCYSNHPDTSRRRIQNLRTSYTIMEQCRKLSSTRSTFDTTRTSDTNLDSSYCFSSNFMDNSFIPGDSPYRDSASCERISSSVSSTVLPTGMTTTCCEPRLTSSCSSTSSLPVSSEDDCKYERMNPPSSTSNPSSHTRRKDTSPYLFSSRMVGLLFCVLLTIGTRPALANMDITAFEYQRKFHKPLDLGECPQREVAVALGNETFLEKQRCTMQQSGTVTHLSRDLTDSRNVQIKSAGEIVVYLGLCGGEAASFLGILNSGDCVAVEIASKLTFNDKTLVRAFVGYYRTSLDILESPNNHLLEGMDRYYKDKYYLKNRSYGTLEIIFVQFRFRSVRDKMAAQAVELPSPIMSEYMRAIHSRVGNPRRVTVINLSTANQETYELKKFNKNEWERALRHVQILELDIQNTREQIDAGVITPHLKYELYPFMETHDKSYRVSNPIPWEKTSMLEVQLRQAIHLAKKTSRKCRNNRTRLCRRVRELRRKLISAQAEIHKGRSNWVRLSAEEKNSFATRYTARVKSYGSVTKTLAKAVRAMRKKEKMERLAKKKNKLNQIPVLASEHISRRQRRQHRIRHSRRRNRVRNG